MTDRPTLFSAPMVRALIREVEYPGTGKTNTRRLAWKECPPPKGDTVPISWRCTNRVGVMERPTIWQKVRPGDRLWVREALRWMPDDGTVRYDATGNILEPSQMPVGWQPSKEFVPGMFMARWASRLTLVVTETKIERLQDIDGLEALAEGITREEGVAPMRVFYRLWNSLHGEGAWQSNPEVVALTFTVHKVNIDAMENAA